MKVNEEREPLAKLQEHEFYLDLEELERLHKESDNEIMKAIHFLKFWWYEYSISFLYKL